MPAVGRKAPNKTHTQSVHFWKDAGWTEESSREWCEDHDYYTDGLDETETQFRWRQYDPEDDKFDYRTQVIEADSISLILGFPKEKGEAKDMKIIDAAIKSHHTATDTESDWDGPGEVAAAPEEEATLRYMHAWIDPDADPNTKQAYKFPHHKHGTDTAANIHGVNNALARLPTANIPDGDRAGVEAHLRTHREDAGLEDQASLEEEDTENRGHREVVSKHEPIRCFEGNAKPHEPFWTWRNAVEAQDEELANESEPEPELELYGYISEYSWFEDDITPKIFKKDLYRYGGGGPVTVRMNSYGGDVIAASLINTFIYEYPGRVTIKIDGVAASAATIVALAGDVIKMRETAYFMIHDPLVSFFFAVLNIQELSRMVDSLQAVKDGIINAYETRTGLSRPRLSKMMTDETWMDAQKALDLGFIDEIMRSEKPIPVSWPSDKAAVVNALRNFKNVPPGLIQASTLTDDQRREAQALSERVTTILRKEKNNA